MQKRNTIQKELILNAVRSLKNHATADEVYALIAENYPSIGKGTVYRNLSNLVEDGQIKKIGIPDGPDRYDHNLTQHYHVKCTGCKKLFDADLQGEPDLKKYIFDTHGVQIISYDVLFKGVCPSCQNGKEMPSF